MYTDGKAHKCNICGQDIINLFEDEELTIAITGDEICWPCEEFGGPVEDMTGLWD